MGYVGSDSGWMRVSVGFEEVSRGYIYIWGE